MKRQIIWAHSVILALATAVALIVCLVACDSNSDTIHVITRESGSGTRNALVYLANIVDENENDAIAGFAERQRTTVGILTGVETNKAAIGYVSFSAVYSNDLVKPLTIDGVSANIANLESGDYVLQRPFNVVNNGKMTAAAQDFWNFVFSAQGQAVVADEEYLVHSDNANAPAFATNSASGLVTVGGSTSMEPLMMRLVAAYEKIAGTAAKIEIQGMGSGAGEVQVVSGAFDIGMVSYEVSNTELTSGVMAIDGIAVIVNNSNAVNDISLDDLRAVFMGEITAWSEL